jgi:hypothetical protein
MRDKWLRPLGYAALLLFCWQTSAWASDNDPKADFIFLPEPAFEVSQVRSDPGRPVRKSLNVYQGPIIDTHAHLYPPESRRAASADASTADLKGILALKKKLRVTRIIFMPTPNDGIRPNQALGVEKRRKIMQMDPSGVMLFGGSNQWTTWLHDIHITGVDRQELARRLADLEKLIDSGLYKGVGEIGLYHFDKGFSKQHVISFPPNFKPFVNMVDLVAAKGVWLDLHAEPVDPEGKSYEQEVFGGIELLYRRNPKLKLICSHTAMTNPLNVRRLLACYPDLVMNIKIEIRHERWKNLEPVVNPEGGLYQDWAEVFESLPQRFTIGTDFHFGRKGVNIKKYKKRIAEVRAVLGALQPDVARLIAYENAQKMF